MREIFDDLIQRIQEIGSVHVEYVDIVDVDERHLFGIRLFESWTRSDLDRKPIAELGFADDKLVMNCTRIGMNRVERTRSLCEPGDPIKIMIKFIKKHVFHLNENNKWLQHDMEHPKYRITNDDLPTTS